MHYSRLTGAARRRRARGGMTTVEYVLVLCLLAVVAFAVWRRFGRTVEARAHGADVVVGRLPGESSE